MVCGASEIAPKLGAFACEMCPAGREIADDRQEDANLHDAIEDCQEWYDIACDTFTRK
jgi:hypothetical protein